MTALVIAAGAAAAAHAQPVPRAAVYVEAIERYTRGDFDAAARAVAGWSSDDLRTGLAELANRRRWRDLEAAAMFHTDLVVLERETAARRISLHLALAEAVVNRLTALRVQPDLPADEIARFQEYWFELGASIYLAMTAPEDADAVLDRGLRMFKRSARLRLFHAIAEEMRSHILDANLHDPAAIAAMAAGGARRRIVLAEHAYKEALDIDPTLVEARMRLGRMLALRNETKAARRELEAAAEGASEPRVKYLAQLFLGALSEYEHDLGGARDSYRAALTLFPEAQSARIALSFVQSLTGHEPEARELAGGIAPGSTDERSDPWADYINGAMSQEAYKWLRARLQP